MLDSTSPIPLYFQLQEILRKDILNGVFKPGEQIPTEKELEEKYEVSRITVRNAISGLVFEDLLIKKQGRGTVVAFPRMMEDGNSKLLSFTEKMASQDVDVSTKVLDAKLLPATERIAEHLNITVGEQIIYTKRLRKINEEPIALFENYISTETGVTIGDDFSKSVYHLFEDKYHIKISGAEKIIEADIAQSEDALLLGIPQGEPILIIRYITFDAQNKPIELSEGIYRGDRYKYVVRLNR